jgi:hypothetical protein
MSRVFTGEMGAQPIAAFPVPNHAQLVASSREGQGLGREWLTRFRELDRHPAEGAAGLSLGRPELEQPLIAAEPLLLERV